MLFLLLSTPNERQNVLGFPDYKSFHDELRDQAQEEEHLLFRGGIELDDQHKVSSICWCSKSLKVINGSALKAFRALKSLYLSNNNLSGVIDVSFLPSSLERVWMNNNEIKGINLSALQSHCPYLKHLKMDNNELSHSLDLKALPLYLETLNLSANSLHGLIVFDCLTLPKTLNSLDLRWNAGLRFCGPTPLVVHAD